jgi:hypothetical protein
MAIALSKEKVQAQHGLMMIYSFIALFLTNALVLMFANSFFPQSLVLGTYSISYWWAIYHAMFKLSVVGTFVMPLVTYYEWKNGTIFTPGQWMITYFVVNFVVLWGVTRFSESLGFGVSSVYVLALFALVLDMAQGMVMMQMGKLIKMK